MLAGDLACSPVTLGKELSRLPVIIYITIMFLNGSRGFVYSKLVLQSARRFPRAMEPL